MKLPSLVPYLHVNASIYTSIFSYRNHETRVLDRGYPDNLIGQLVRELKFQRALPAIYVLSVATYIGARA